MKRVIIMSLVALLGIASITSCRYVRDGKETMYQEFKPSELLRKYEYFKDVHAQLSAKLATLAVYEANLEGMKADYEGTSRKDWDRFDKTQFNQWKMELAGIKASYNTLAAEYNAAMAKFNYAFCNTGTLPQGATEPLPREYAPYVYE